MLTRQPSAKRAGCVVVLVSGNKIKKKLILKN